MNYILRKSACGIGFLCFSMFARQVGVLNAAEPRVLVDGYHVERIAQQPEIVTPVGLSFDNQGRLLVVESQTHERPQNYDGPPTDRIRLATDADGDGRLDRWTTFADGFRFALNVLARPDGGVYVVSRSKVELLRDSDDDGVADQRTDILRLDTSAVYPHNGLSGIALDLAANELVVCLGENFGEPYTLIGSDGTRIAGSGGRNGVFRCSFAGEKLRQIATGFWNPFGVCVAPPGRVFVVDNDPDSCPPCRLVHVVPGGDYGYLYQYGRSGLHPLQCWDGQLPGTLPMVAGVGEAPTAIVAHRGRLWVTSWGEHTIEAYRLIPRGASFSATRETVVQGDADFRPTGLAVAPDGSLYFGDWIRRDYGVHGAGRVWRLSLPSDSKDIPFPPPSAAEQKADRLRANNRLPNFATDFDASDPFLATAAAFGLANNSEPASQARESLTVAPLNGPAAARLQLLMAKRLADHTNLDDDLLRVALQDDSPAVRLIAVRWIADEHHTSLVGDVARLLDAPSLNERYYLAVLAAVDWLSNPPRQRNSQLTDGLLVRELRNTERPPATQVLALRLLAPNNSFLTSDRLRFYLQSNHPPLRLAAVRALAQQTRPERFELLGEVARDASQKDQVRAEAVMGLGAEAARFEPLLEELAEAEGDNQVVKQEASRVLRLAHLKPSVAETKPPAADIQAWLALVAQPGDAAAGRRLFFSAVASRCSICHRVEGQGGTVGPDLTGIGRRVSRERLLTSILRPSLEIAPQYQSWELRTANGRSYSGLRLPEAGDNGSEEYMDSAGDRFQLASETIESRRPSAASVMPDGLARLISIDDLRDLLTFLTSPGYDESEM